MPGATTNITNIGNEDEVLACLQRIENHLEYLREQWEAWAPIVDTWRTSGLLAARRAMRGNGEGAAPGGRAAFLGRRQGAGSP